MPAGKIGQRDPYFVPLRYAPRGPFKPRQVILPSFNFLAAPAAVVWAGLEPLFVEVDPVTFTLDPAAVERAISVDTAAILGCHTFGCPCDTERLTAIAAAVGVPLVIDAASQIRRPAPETVA